MVIFNSYVKLPEGISYSNQFPETKSHPETAPEATLKIASASRQPRVDKDAPATTRRSKARNCETSQQMPTIYMYVYIMYMYIYIHMF